MDVLRLLDVPMGMAIARIDEFSCYSILCCKPRTGLSYRAQKHVNSATRMNVMQSELGHQTVLEVLGQLEKDEKPSDDVDVPV